MSNVRVIITEKGLSMLNEKIKKMEAFVKDIQAEKAIAYTASGDGWHDNPGFNQLEQKEYQTVTSLQELKTKRDNAMVIKIRNRNIQSVQIGSVVQIEQCFLKDNSKKQIAWEIVGHEETNLKLNQIAYDTPVGKALIGRGVHDTVEIELPVGKVRFTILELCSEKDMM